MLLSITTHCVWCNKNKRIQCEFDLVQLNKDFLNISSEEYNVLRVDVDLEMEK